MYKTALGKFLSANRKLHLLNVTRGTRERSYMDYTKVPATWKELYDSINNRRKRLSGTDITEYYKLSFDAHYLIGNYAPLGRRQRHNVLLSDEPVAI